MEVSRTHTQPGAPRRPRRAHTGSVRAACHCRDGHTNQPTCQASSSSLAGKSPTGGDGHTDVGDQNGPLTAGAETHDRLAPRPDVVGGAPDGRRAHSRPTSPADGGGRPPPPSAAELRRVCYFCMEPKTGITLAQVDGSLCTHLVLAFARINAQAQLVTARPTDQDYLGQVAEFKRRHPQVKVMISIVNDCDSNGFAMLALANNELRYKFAKSAVEFLERHHLDGVDLHWEFPNFPSGLFNLRGEYERAGLTKILKSLRSALVENFFARQQCEQQQELTRRNDHHHHHNGNKHHHNNRAKHQQPAPAGHRQPVEQHLLTVAIGGQESILRASYELKQLTNLCDWLNVMSYDYFLFKPYLPFTGPNSPLHPIVEHYPILNKLAMSWTVQRLLNEGLDRDKLVVGIPCYARAYRLVFHQTTPVPFTLALGTRGGQLDDQLNYREVVELLARPDTVVEFDERARVPYLLAESGYVWISFESPQSVREKVRYIADQKLGGYMTWNLNSDDFIGGSPDKPTKATPEDQSGCLASEQAQAATTTVTFPLHRAMLDEALNHPGRADHDGHDGGSL
jgi:chitinase